MKMVKYKLFWKKNDNKHQVEIIEWRETEQEYYSFVKEQLKAGYHQITLTTEIMLGLLEIVAISRFSNVSSIELLEDDEEETQYLNDMIELSIENRGNIIRIINNLKCLEEKSSIEVKRIGLTEIINGKTNMLFVQVNGLLGMTSTDSALLRGFIKYVEESITL